MMTDKKQAATLAELTWKYCASCSPDSREDCEKCWAEWSAEPDTAAPGV